MAYLSEAFALGTAPVALPAPRGAARQHGRAALPERGVSPTLVVAAALGALAAARRHRGRAGDAALVVQAERRELPPLPPLPSLQGRGPEAERRELPPLPPLPSLQGRGPEAIPPLPPLPSSGPKVPLPPLPAGAALAPTSETAQQAPVLPPLPPLPSNGSNGASAVPLPPLPPLQSEDKPAAALDLPPLPPLPEMDQKAPPSPLPPMPPLPGLGEDAATRPLPPLPGLGEDVDENGSPTRFVPMPPLPPISTPGEGPPPLPPMFGQGADFPQRMGVGFQHSAAEHKERDWSDHPEREKPVDYISVRLQSPAEIRAAARLEGSTKNEVNGEVLTPQGFYSSPKSDDRMPPPPETVPGGLFCERIFGPRKMYSRRKKMGYIELAWPCAHVWFSGNGKLGRAAQTLGKKPSEILSVRQFQKDLFLGEWTAPRVETVLEDPITGGPRVAAVGSPVAAAEAPKLRKMLLFEADSQEEQPDADEGDSDDDEEEALVLTSREDHVASLLLKEACKDLPEEAANLSRVARKVLHAVSRPEYQDCDPKVVAQAIRLGAKMPQLVSELQVLMEISRGPEESEEESRKRAYDARTGLIGCAADAICEESGCKKDTAMKLIALGLSPEEPPASACRRFRRLARQDFYGFWKSLALPGFGDNLEETLQRIAADLHEVQASDAALALQICQKLINRSMAALDLAIRAYEPENPTCRRSRGGQPSRHEPQFSEVQWYDPSIAPAAFHLEDVERLAESELANPGRFHEASRPTASSSSAARIEASSVIGSAEERSKQASGKLTRPRLGERRSGARFYRRGESANPRWHLPLQDAERPGCAGGQRILEIGEVVPSDSAFWADYAASRPRPTTMPAPIPFNMEAEGTLYVGTGAAPLRQALCQLEPSRIFQRSVWQLNLLESVAKTRPSPAIRSNLVLGSVNTRSTRSSPSGIQDRVKELRARRNMMETAVSRHQLPEWMVLTSLPVLPPDLRARSPNGSFMEEESPDDMNVMYKDVLAASRQLQVSLLEGSSAGLLRYRKVMLQRAVDSVIDNGRISPARVNNQGQPLESVAKRLKGKKGRMRKNMLGKRVDYSARTVIVVEPKLELDQCGLPFEIAKEMYRPFLLAELQKQDLPETGTHGLLSWFEDQTKEKQHEILSAAMGDRQVILNRAPTLHRLSMQAFKPVLIDGKALKIHPLVCSPFNADFDGDTMTIHLVLSKAAQEEAESLMLPSQNFNSPATGDPVIGPTQDMVLGLYYMTSVSGSMLGPPQVIGSVAELEELTIECSAGNVSHLQEVHVPRAVLQQVAPQDDNVADDPEGDDPVRTTAGRLQFFMMLHSGKLHPMRSNGELLDKLDAAPLVGPDEMSRQLA